MHAQNRRERIRERSARYRLRFRLTAQNIDFQETTLRSWIGAFVFQRIGDLLMNRNKGVRLDKTTQCLQNYPRILSLRKIVAARIQAYLSRNGIYSKKLTLRRARTDPPLWTDPTIGRADRNQKQILAACRTQALAQRDAF